MRACPEVTAVPHVTSSDRVKLYYEETGRGLPIVFVHEFAGDHRSYEPQMRHFGRRYRCVAYNARGYPPSDVPTNPASYSQDAARDDLLAILDGLELAQAHLVGISMGGFATLHFGMKYQDRARSLVVAGCGYGSAPDRRSQFQEEAEAAARRFETLDIRESASAYAVGPTRVQFQNKDPRGWEEFRAMLTEHSRLGSALTLRGVQKLRPSLYDCLEASLMMKRTIPSSALAVLPRTGHGLNLEEPASFNAHLDDFFHQVEAGRWTLRDPRSLSGSIL
jgi:pimeloyl-ACP methyl ester carboxylesterase